MIKSWLWALPAYLLASCLCSVPGWRKNKGKVGNDRVLPFSWFFPSSFLFEQRSTKTKTQVTMIKSWLWALPAYLLASCLCSVPGWRKNKGKVGNDRVLLFSWFFSQYLYIVSRIGDFTEHFEKYRSNCSWWVEGTNLLFHNVFYFIKNNPFFSSWD